MTTETKQAQCTVAIQGGYVWAAQMHAGPEDAPERRRYIHREIAKLCTAATKYQGTVVREMAGEAIRKAAWARPRKDGSPPTEKQIVIKGELLQ